MFNLICGNFTNRLFATPRHISPMQQLYMLSLQSAKMGDL